MTIDPNNSWQGEGDTDYGFGPGVSPTTGNYGLGGGQEPDGTVSAERRLQLASEIASMLGAVGFGGVAGISGLVARAPVNSVVAGAIYAAEIGAVVGAGYGFAVGLVANAVLSDDPTLGLAGSFAITPRGTVEYKK